MSVLKRNKELVRERRAGKSLVELGRKYGVHPTNLSAAFYAFEKIIDRPFYDAVADLDLSDQVGTKLVNALHKYERLHNVDLTPEYIAAMEREEFITQRGVGVSVARAFDRFREALNDES